MPPGMTALRAPDIERAGARCLAGLKAGHGTILFVEGPPASGRSALLGCVRLRPTRSRGRSTT